MAAPSASSAGSWTNCSPTAATASSCESRMSARRKEVSDLADAGGPLRLVLFGLPGAGKTALLGALVQAARTQDQVLGTKLDDFSPGLDDLQPSGYQKGPSPTRDEVIFHRAV